MPVLLSLRESRPDLANPSRASPGHRPGLAPRSVSPSPRNHGLTVLSLVPHGGESLLTGASARPGASCTIHDYADEGAARRPPRAATPASQDSESSAERRAVQCSVRLCDATELSASLRTPAIRRARAARARTEPLRHVRTQRRQFRRVLDEGTGAPTHRKALSCTQR